MASILNLLIRLPFEAFRAICISIYRLNGWRVEGELPQADKFLAVAAPHTSNWDLPFLLCIALYYRTRVRWIGKAALFKPPFGWLMSMLGGIPVDRSKTGNVVAEMVDVFARREKLVLGIAPEGTRAKVRNWKSGFYNIAHGACVPIALGFLDYKRKVGGIGMTMRTTGDYEADLAKIRAFYATVTPKYPDQGEQSGETERPL